MPAIYSSDPRPDHRGPAKPRPDRPREDFDAILRQGAIVPLEVLAGVDVPAPHAAAELADTRVVADRLADLVLEWVTCPSDDDAALIRAAAIAHAVQGACSEGRPFTLEMLAGADARAEETIEAHRRVMALLREGLR